MSAGEKIIQFIKDLDPRAAEAIGIRRARAMRGETKTSESLYVVPIDALRSAVRGGVLSVLVDLGVERLFPGHGIPLDGAFLLGTSMDMIQSVLRSGQTAIKEARRGGFMD